jgi:cysteinyl-tRNA synthetase
LREAARGPGTGGGDSSLAVRAALEDDLDTPRALRLLEEAVTGRDAGWRTAAEILGLRLEA